MSRRRARKPHTVRGVDLSGPRLTRWGWTYLALYIALPVLALAFLLDLLFYVVADRVFGVCYAVLCLF